MLFSNSQPVQLTLDLVADDWQLQEDYIEHLWANGLAREDLTYHEWFTFWRV